MAKKYVFSILLGGILLFTGLASAATNCDDKAKPAFSCPEGYSMMCIPAGGDHWGCGKASGDSIFEIMVPTGAESTAGKGTVQTQTRTLELGQNAESNAKPKIGKIVVNGWDDQKKQEVENGAKIVLENNREITSVNITEDNVEFKYSATARFLGFLPMKMNVTISSDKDGRVKVKFPWYRFLVRTDYSNIAEEINGVFQSSEIDLEFLKLNDTVERQIKLFNLLSIIMKVKHDTVKNSINNIR